jgi:hypothetical protein
MAAENEKPVYLMMNMPRWFIELPEEEKIELAKKFARDSDSDQPLSDAELAELLSLSAE